MPPPPHIHIHRLQDPRRIIPMHIHRRRGFDDILLALAPRRPLFLMMMRRPRPKFHIIMINSRLLIAIRSIFRRRRNTTRPRTATSSPAAFAVPAADFSLVFAAAVGTVGAIVGAGGTGRFVASRVAAEEEGEMVADEGAEDHGAAADDGEVAFDEDEGGGGYDVPAYVVAVF